MNALMHDLLRWEKGELTLEQVESAHPEAGVRDLMRLHTRLSMLRAIPLPDVDRAWSMTLPRLEGSPATESQPVHVLKRSSRLRDWARRPIAASFAAVVMSGGMAYAAGVEPVQRAVNGMWEQARDMTGFDGSDGGDEVTSTAPVPTGESADENTGDGTEEHGKSESRGNSATHRKDGENKHRGHVHKKDKKEKGNEGDHGKDDSPGLTGENPGNGTPPASSGNDDSSKPDRVKDKNDNAAPGAGTAEIHVDVPDESTDGGAAAPAPAAPGASGEDHGNGNGSGKDEGKTRA